MYIRNLQTEYEMYLRQTSNKGYWQNLLFFRAFSLRYCSYLHHFVREIMFVFDKIKS